LGEEKEHGEGVSFLSRLVCVIIVVVVVLERQSQTKTQNQKTMIFFFCLALEPAFFGVSFLQHLRAMEIGVL